VVQYAKDIGFFLSKGEWGMDNGTWKAKLSFVIPIP